MKDEILEMTRAEGYDLAGFARLELSQADLDNLQEYTDQGRHGEMQWFLNHQELRKHPADIHPGAQTALVLGTVYRRPAFEAILAESPVKISRYAAGRDYHKILRKKGKRLLARIQELEPGAEGRIVVDSAPVPEKILGRMAGLGWQGKHTNLINPELGSYFFLSVLLLNLELPEDGPQTDLCGTCTLCLDACPTGALEPYQIHASRCISYLTIETDGPHPPELREKVSGWAFGCDICQEVCPYNRNRKTRNLESREDAFQVREEILAFLKAPEDLNSEGWEELSQGSPLRRPGFEKFKDNVDAARGR